MKVFTIGFKRRRAKDFFPVLKQAGVQKVIDVRRNNTSQLAGFTKEQDLKFFLEECFGIAYEHVPEFAPSQELLKEYRMRLGKKKKDDAAWEFYTARFREEIATRPIVACFKRAAEGFDDICLLCSEETADRCHRRLLAEYLREQGEDAEIRHL